MSMFTLTPLTGRKKNSQRTQVILTIEASRKTWIAGIIGFFLGLIAFAPFMIFFGTGVGIIGAPLGSAGVIWLVTARQKNGLRLPVYQAMRDRRLAKRRQGKLMLCGEPLDDKIGVSETVRTAYPVAELAQRQAAAPKTPVVNSHKSYLFDN